MRTLFKNKIEDSWLFYVLIVLPCFNFLGKGSLFYLIFALFACFKMVANIRLDSNFFFSLLLTLSVALASVAFYDFNEVIKAFNYVLLYLVGYNGFFAAYDKIKFIKRTIAAIFTGFAANIVVTYFYNLNRVNTDYYRILYNFWTGELIAVTIIGLLSSVVIGYSFYAIFVQKKLATKIIGIISVVFMILINVQTATRTPFLLLVITYLFMFLLRFLNGTQRKKARGLVLFALIMTFMVLLYQNDTWGIKTYVLSTPIYERFMDEGMETSRIEIFKFYFDNMSKSFLGGDKVHALYGQSAHNFIQEGFDKYGILALVSLLGLSINIIASTVKMICIKRKTDIEFLLIAMYISIMIQICLEPTFDGYPVAIMSLLMVHGMASAYNLKRDDLIRSVVE